LADNKGKLLPLLNMIPHTLVRGGSFLFVSNTPPLMVVGFILLNIIYLGYLEH